MFKRMIAVLIAVSMLLQQAGFAQAGMQPVVSSYMQSLLPVDAFSPVQMRALSFDASGAASLFLDRGSDQQAGQEALEQSVDRLMDYFYIGLVLPNSCFWVNLRPDSQDQIIDPLLEKTDLGNVLLEADLQLKKDLAALTSPNTPQGKAYWEKLYTRAESLFGQENTEIPTHTRPWIVPGEIIIKETPNGAYVYKAGLKVMLEEDYARDAKEGQAQLAQSPAFSDPRLQQLNDYSTQLIRSTILPMLTRQVNASRKYAQLRQAYYSLVLAQWFKSKRLGSASLLKRIDSKDLSGLTSTHAWSKQSYFNDYKQSFEKGEYSKEETVRTSGGVTVRTYFSGGLNFQAPVAAYSFKGNEGGFDRSLMQVKLPASNRDGGIGFTMYKGAELRNAQRVAVAAEIRKELEKPGSSDLPSIAFISDYHGDANRFAQLLSDALRQIAGFKGTLNPRDSIEVQLNKQGLSLKTLKSPIYLGGDLFDRGTEGIQCFMMVKEMITLAPERIFYISGNHDFWAFGNLLGLHLPWYEGFRFYDESTPGQFIDALKGAQELIKGKQASNPELFESQDAFRWWTARLAEYNAEQDAFQAAFFDGKVKKLRAEFVKFYQDNSGKWDEQQIKAMEDFAGHFARIKVPDPYVGLNGVGKTSTIWWQDLHTRLMEAYNTRKAAGADELELAMWDRSLFVCEEAVKEVHDRLTRAMDEGQWWYFIFEAINTQAYASVEWWCKDWSSHKGWGEAVIAEINRLIDEGVLEGPKIDQSNYIDSPVLQAYAKFQRANFNLYLKDPYGNLYSHGWFPVQPDGSISMVYQGKEFKGAEIFEALDAITAEVADFSKSLSELREGLKVVNTWYADETTIIKPENIRENREKIGVAAINKGIGVLNWTTGHNTLDKLDTQFLTQDGAYAHMEADNGMAPKFGGKGGYVLLGPQGICMRGFEDKESTKIVTAPASGINVHVGMPAEEYLGNVLTHLWIEGKDGGVDDVLNDFYHELFMSMVQKKLEATPTNETLALISVEKEALLMELNEPGDSLEIIITVLSRLEAGQIEELKVMAENIVELKERGIPQKLAGALQLRPNFGPQDAPRMDGGKQELSTARPGLAVNNLGGIDFRGVPAQAVNAALGMPAVDIAAIKALAESSKMTDLNKEWTEIEKCMRTAQLPTDKVKEFVAVCSVKGSKDQLARVQEAILHTIKMEEACAIETSAQERELLVMLESI